MTYTKTAAPEPVPANHLGFILQQPHLWNRRHQEYLKVRIDRDVIPEMVVGMMDFPHDGDEGVCPPDPLVKEPRLQVITANLEAHRIRSSSSKIHPTDNGRPDGASMANPRVPRQLLHAGIPGSGRDDRADGDHGARYGYRE